MDKALYSTIGISGFFWCLRKRSIDIYKYRCYPSCIGGSLYCILSIGWIPMWPGDWCLCYTHSTPVKWWRLTHCSQRIFTHCSGHCEHNVCGTIVFSVFTLVTSSKGLTMMPECRCQTEVVGYRKKCRCRSIFCGIPVFTYDFSTSYSKNNTSSSRLWMCTVAGCIRFLY